MRERVTRCAKILDSLYKQWISKINWRKLDLQDKHRCVFGQIFGSYDKGLEFLKKGGYDDLAPWRYGVSLKFDEVNESNWNKLNDYWIKELKGRLWQKKNQK